MGDMVGFVVPCMPLRGSMAGDDTSRSASVVVAGLAKRIVYLNLDTDEMKTIVPVELSKPLNRCNDGKVDPEGRLWAGTMCRECKGGDVKEISGNVWLVRSRCVVSRPPLLALILSFVKCSFAVEVVEIS